MLNSIKTKQKLKIRFIGKLKYYKIKKVDKIKTSTSKENKEIIKRRLKDNLKNTNLKDIFDNLDNDKVPDIFNNKEKNQDLIKKYKGKKFFSSVGLKDMFLISFNLQI